jgi:hypothetical protein
MSRKTNRPEGASAWMGSATQAITNRVLSSPAYQTCVALTIARATEAILASIRGLPEAQQVATMRTLGGFTKVIERTLEQVIAESPDANKQMGSKMFPVTPADELRRDARMWCGEVQTRVADALLPSVTP